MISQDTAALYPYPAAVHFADTWKITEPHAVRRSLIIHDIYRSSQSLWRLTLMVPDVCFTEQGELRRHFQKQDDWYYSCWTDDDCRLVVYPTKISLPKYSIAHHPLRVAPDAISNNGYNTLIIIITRQEHMWNEVFLFSHYMYMRTQHCGFWSHLSFCFFFVCCVLTIVAMVFYKLYIKLLVLKSTQLLRSSLCSSLSV